MPEHSVALIQKSYEVFPQLKNERSHLQTLIEMFQSASFSYGKLVSHTPVQAIVIPENTEVKKVFETLQQHGIDVRPVLYPSVAKGSERLRIILHSFNSKNELAKLIDALQTGQ